MAQGDEKPYFSIFANKKGFCILILESPQYKKELNTYFKRKVDEGNICINIEVPYQKGFTVFEMGGFIQLIPRQSKILKKKFKFLWALRGCCN